MEKTYEIQENQSKELLKALHILTRDGKLNQDSRRKLKQVYHLVNFIKPVIESYKDQPFKLIDHGAGKSYLGFILFDLIIKETQGEVFGVEINDALVTKSRLLMKKFGFDRMTFLSEAIANTDDMIHKANIVTALHACDVATDHAIDFALKKNADWMMFVPCCQAEIYQSLKKNKADQLKKPLSELWRHNIHTREFGSHLTNVLRCLKLESAGDKVTVTELVGWEHAMKNELILAENIGQPKPTTKERIEKILFDFGLEELKSRFIIN